METLEFIIFILGICYLKIEQEVLDYIIWNDNYIFASQNYDRFVLIDISSPKIKKYFSGHKNEVNKIMKLIHPKYGECLITIDQYKTKLWIIKNEGSKRKKIIK